MARHELADREWKIPEPLVLARFGSVGGSKKTLRSFVNGVVWRTRPGVPWRDLLPRFGAWKTVARRFRRWAVLGVWQDIFTAIQEPDWEWILVDSTAVTVHPHAAGQKKTRQRRRPSGAAAAA